jgi:hypothetical protein
VNRLAGWLQILRGRTVRLPRDRLPLDAEALSDLHRQLQTIMSYTELLQRSDLTEDQRRQFLRYVWRASLRASELLAREQAAESARRQQRVAGSGSTTSIEEDETDR